MQPVQQVQVREALDVGQAFGKRLEDLHVTEAAVRAHGLDRGAAQITMLAMNDADRRQCQRLWAHVRFACFHSAKVPHASALRERRSRSFRCLK